MEGDGGVVAMAQALKEAGMAFMVNDGGCKATHFGPMLAFNHASPARQHWQTSQAAQTPHFNFRNNCQTSHCQVSSNSPSRRGHFHSHCAYQSPTRYVTNKTGGCLNNANAYSLARGYQSSVVITNTPPAYRLKPSPNGPDDAFVSSLRKYPKSPERSISADFIQRLLTYTHQKSSIMKNSHTSRSHRSIRRRSRDTTRLSSPLCLSRRSRAKVKTPTPSHRGGSPEIPRRRKEWNEGCTTLDPSYDYLKSPVNRLSPTRVSEVHYLNDFTRFVRESLRNLSPTTDYEPCPFLANRLMEHKKKCPKANNNSAASGSKKRNSQSTVSSEAQTSRSTDENCTPRTSRNGCMMTSQSVQASHQQSQDSCECESPGFSLRKLRFLPLPMCAEVICSESAEYHEWLDDKLRDIIIDWVKTIPVNGDFDENDKEVRKGIAKELRAKILRLINEDKFEDEAKDVILDNLDKMPMWYPDEDKKKFQDKIANNLINNLNDLTSNLKMFDMLFDEWFEELKLKPVDAKGKELNKERIRTQLSHSIKPIVIDRIIEDELKTSLKNETLNIVEDLPLDVRGNQNEYVKEVASKLIDSFTKNDREKVLEKKKKETKSSKASKSEESSSMAVESFESEKKERNKESRQDMSRESKKKIGQVSSKKRRSRSSNDSSASNRRTSRNNEDINVSLTLSGHPSFESRDSKVKVHEINNLICDWMSAIPQLTEICKENEESVKQLARHVVQIEEDRIKDDEMKEEALKEEVLTWLGDVVEKEKMELMPKSILKLTNDLVDKIEQVYTVPLEEIMKKEESDDSFDYFDDEVCDWLQEINDLPNELLKPEHQGPILKLAKDFRDLQGASDETVQSHFKGQIQNWLDNALGKENLRMDARTKSFVIGDLLQRLCDAKSGNYELNTLEDDFTREILEWVVNIPQIAKVRDVIEYQNIVKNLAKDLNVLQRRHGVDASDARGLILHKIDDFLETTLQKEGEEIDESEKKMLLDDLLTNLIRKTKKHSVAAIYRQTIRDWLDDVPELEEITGKDEFQRPIARLADKIAGLNKEAETDQEVKREIKDEVKLWLGKVIKKEKAHIHPTQKDKVIENLMDSINTIDENRLDVHARNFENEIMKWLDNIPEIANIANNETFKNEIKDLARDINMFQRRQGIDATDMRDSILNRLRGFLDNALAAEGGHLSDQDKEKFLNKLLSNLVESSRKPDETIKDKILVEVKDWLDNIPELAKTSKNTKEMTRKLVADLNELQEDGIDNLVVREEFLGKIKKFFNAVCDTENIKMTGKAKKGLTNNLMERLENLILRPPEFKQEQVFEEEESDDIPDWLDEVPGLDEAIQKKTYKKPKTMTMLASIMSLSNIEYDFGEEIKKYFDEDNEIRYTMNEFEQKLFNKLAKKFLLLNDDDEVKYDIENYIKDYLDAICKRRHKYLDSKTKNLIATRLIAKARLRLDQERIAYDTSKNLIKSLQTWSSLLSFDSGHEDTDSISSDKLENSRKKFANRKRWNKDIGFQFSSSETENSFSRSPSPVKLMKNRQKMNKNDFVSKQTFSTRSSRDPTRRAAARDNNQSTSGQAATSEGIQRRSYVINSDRNDTRERPVSLPYESRANSYKTYPINNLESFKRKPSTKVYYVDDKKPQRKDDLKMQISRIEKDAKRSISSVIEKGKYKLPTANSNQVKREIIEVLRQKVGLSESEAWPLAENIIKKARTVYKSDDDEFDLREVIRDEMRDVLDEAGITTCRDEIEQSLTDLLADEILSGEVDTYTKNSVFNILRSANVYDPVADNLTSQVIEKANEINEKVKSNKSGIKITPDTFRNIAEREVIEFVEGRIDELTPFMKRKVSVAAEPLIEKLENIISDTRKSPEDKTYEMKSELKSFLKKFSLNKDESEDVMADKLIGRLYARMNPARSRLNNVGTALFRLSTATDAGRSSDTLQSPTKKQEFIKLAANEITDLLDEKCRHMTKEYRDKLVPPTGDLLDKLGDVVIDNTIRQANKRERIRLDIGKFFNNLPIDIEDSPEDCTKQLMFKLEAILPNFLHSDDVGTSRRISIQSNLTVAADKQPTTPKAQYNRRMSIAVPKERSEETENVLSNMNTVPITDYNTAQRVRSNSNAGSNSGEQSRRNSSNAGRNSRSNLNTEKQSSASVNKLPPSKTDHKESNPNTPRSSKNLQSKGDEAIEKELLELITTKLGEITQEEMDHIKVTTNQLVQIAKTIGADRDLTIDDKIDQVKDSITNYLRLIPLADDKTEEEIAATILSKLEMKLFHKGFASSTPRQSIQDSDVLKTNEQCYLNQLRNIIENWVHELPIIQDSIQDINLKQDMIDNLVTDIDNRQKYLQLNLETKPCCEEELENLKYQVFRWLNKFLDIDDLSPFLSNIAALMDRIRRVPVPKLVKPSSKALQEEICKFIEQTPPHLLATDDRTYQQQGVRELADRLLSDIEKTDASARVDSALQSWVPKMFTGTIQDLNRLADMLRSTLKKKGLLESKVDKAHKKATDVLNDTIENWCDDLPLYGNLEEQDHVRKIKNDLFNKLIHKIAQFNLDPQLFNDEFLYEDMVSDEIDKLTEWLPKNPELEKYLPALKKDLVSQIKFARQNIMEEIAGQAFKYQLRDVISSTLRTPEVLTTEELASLELVKENLADAFISVHYSFDCVEGKRLLKDKIAREINKYCYDFFRRRPMSSINSSKINRELYEALLSVPIPTDGSIRIEVEQLYIKNIIKEWMRDLPLKEETGRELLTRTKMITILTKRLHEIEQEKDLDPNLDTNTKMFEEIIKTMKKLALKPIRESDVPKMALKLVEKLRQTEEYRYSFTIDDTNKTLDDPNCSCSSRQVAKPPKCGLSVSDKVHLQKIRERVKSRMSCYKDASVNPAPVDTGSQVDITVPRPCEKPVYDTCSGKRLFPNIRSWVDPVCPNSSQSSTQTARYTKAPNQEISPQVIIREHCWEPSESPIMCSRKNYEVSSTTSCKASAQKNNVRDSATQDITSCLPKDQSCQCKCDKCTEARTKKSPQKSPQTSTDAIDNPTSYESWEVERPCTKRTRTRRCRTRYKDLGEYPERRDDELAYWDDSRPVLRPNILNIPADVEAFKRMRRCECEEKHKPRRCDRSDGRLRPCDQYQLCQKCLSSKCPHPSYMFFR